MLKIVFNIILLEDELLQGDNDLADFLIQKCRIQELITIDREDIITFIKIVESCSVVLPELAVTLSVTDSFEYKRMIR